MRRCAHVCSWAAIVHLRTTTRLAATTVQLRTTCKRLFAVSGMRCIQRSATRVPLVWHRPAANRRKPHSLEVRCFSKKRKEDEKSWAEIAEEAVDIAKAVVGKVIKTGENIIKTSDKKSSATTTKSREDNGSMTRSGDLFSNLMGQTMGRLMSNIFRGLSEQIAETQRQTRDVYSIAAERLQKNSQIRSALGSVVSCGIPYSQSSSSQSINGVTSKRTVLEFPLSGSKSNATAQVEAIENASQGRDIKIKVRLPTGQVIRLDLDSNGGGRTIDVDWKDV